MIKTLVNVVCAEDLKAQPYTGKVIGKILSISNTLVGNMISVNYAYLKEDGIQLFADVKVLSYTEADAFYDLIKAGLNKGLSYTDSEKEIFYTAFKVEMAGTFGIGIEQIENI